MFPIELLPERLRRSWCVAGGYAACPGAASDVDLWVFGIRTGDLLSERIRLLTHLNDLNPPPSTTPVPRGYKPRPRMRFLIEPGEETRTTESYCQEYIQILKVATVYGRYGYERIVPVHLLVTDAPGPGEILMGFDISTHAIAIGHDGRVWKHQWTKPSESPHLLRASNHYTVPRMHKICERFGHTAPDMAHLLTQTVTSEETHDEAED